MPPPPRVQGRGPVPAKIMIVTEAATADDVWKGYPLAGNGGDFFCKLLHSAGIIRSECYITAACKTRPSGDNLDGLYTQVKATASRLNLTEVMHGTWVHPSVQAMQEELFAEVQRVQPTVILAVGDFAMFLLTGVYGAVATWRGSHLDCLCSQATVIPTYPPATIYKAWDIKGFVVRDMQRARDIAARPELYTYPTYDFLIAPTFAQATSVLEQLLSRLNRGEELRLAVDLETIARYISCVGLAWNAREALCIPFMTLNGHYWTEAEEIEISFLLKSVLTHPYVQVNGQNFNYDNQHFAKHLGYLPRLTFDTMIAQHVLFPGIPKALDFLSSMYCHWHRYWKDEIEDYNKLPENMEQYWTYNCKDVCVTYEVALVLEELLTHLRRWPQFDFMFHTSNSALRTMLKGIRVDAKARSEVAAKLMGAIAEYDALIQDLVGFPLNVGSPQQMQNFFYKQLGLPIQIDRKTKRPTCNAKALATLSQKEPLIRPLTELIEKKRSLGVFLKTFCMMPLDTDGRMRCSFNVCGTETMRFSSSANAFGTGGNLQNIPKGEEE